VFEDAEVVAVGRVDAVAERHGEDGTEPAAQA
jgi:hypothetical protein